MEGYEGTGVCLTLIRFAFVWVHPSLVHVCRDTSICINMCACACACVCVHKIKHLRQREREKERETDTERERDRYVPDKQKTDR